MPDLIASNRYKISLGKQVAETTAQTTQPYQIPVYASSLKPMETRTDYEVIQGDSYRPGQFKAKAWGEGTVEWAAFPDAGGLLIASHLGLDTKTGAGDPFTHTITQNNAPFWVTMYVARPLAGTSYEYDQYLDCLLKTCDIVYENGQMPKIVTDILAKKVTTKATAPTITLVKSLDTATERFSPFSPTFLFNLDTTPAAASVTSVQNFTFHMGYDSADFLSTVNLNPDYRDMQLWTVGFNGTFLMSDWNAYYTTFFGSLAPSANTPQSAIVVRGAVDVTLQIGPPTSAGRTLRITMPAVELNIEAPEPNNDGSGLSVSLTGALEKPPSGEPITFVLTNGVGTAY
jgi:hypothetical protein